MDIVERLQQPVMMHSNPEQTNAERREAAAVIDELRKIRDGCEKIMLGRKTEIERLREALLVNGLRWSAETKEVINAKIDQIARGGDEPSEVTVRRERDEEWK
jgi:hypothetical protein